MNRAQKSEWWSKRGDAWDALQRAEQALLEARARGSDESLDVHARNALGCIAGAREMLVLATERLHAIEDEEIGESIKHEGRP